MSPTAPRPRSRAISSSATALPLSLSKGEKSVIVPAGGSARGDRRAGSRVSRRVISVSDAQVISYSLT
ncbi:hypothetical protein ACFRAA_32545 [[Kitasatospora] papulosa]|uniref:hypothetical protein n=1 Tax=Streptomyces TaxID=1883 RepID=UPI0029A64609|nr:hypothetical protein [Streptomyces sp. ME02-7008A]